jgi:hypothetical protein
MFCMRLARSLHKSLAEVLCLTREEIAMWAAFFELEADNAP